MSFGYSIGDVLAGCTLAHDVVKLLANPKEATKAYQEAYFELLAMNQVFNQAIMVLQEHSIPQEVKNGIAHIAISSIDTIDKFKISAEKYHQEFMSKNKVGWAQTKWTQAGWVMFKQSELTTLKTQLRAQIDAIAAYKSFYPNMKSLKVPRDIARYEDHSTDKAPIPEVSSARVAQEVLLPVESPDDNHVLTIAPNSTIESMKHEPLSDNDDIGGILELRNDTTDPPRAVSIASKSIDTWNKLAPETLVKRIVSEMRQAEQEAIKAAQPAKPIRFKDCVGRKFFFPFDLSNTWSGIEELIKQSFLHVDVIGPHVQAGHYDLLGPENDIILPQIWERVIKPDTAISMVMWPMDRPARKPGTVPGVRPYSGPSPPPPPPPPSIPIHPGMMLPGQSRHAAPPQAPFQPQPPPFRPTPSQSQPQPSQLPPPTNRSHPQEPMYQSGMGVRPPVLSHSGSNQHIVHQKHPQNSRSSLSPVMTKPGSRRSNPEDSRRNQKRYRKQQPIRRPSYSSSGSSHSTSGSCDTDGSDSSSDSYESRAKYDKSKSDVDESDSDGTEDEEVPELIDACYDGNLRSLERLLNEGADVHETDSKGATALHIASSEGHYRIVKSLLRHGAAHSAKDHEGETPVFYAAENGHLKILKLLLKKGADISVQSTQGFTATQSAILVEKDEVAEFLINESSQEYPSLLVTAVASERLNIVKLLLDKGQSPRTAGGTDFGLTDLCEALSRWSALDIVCSRGKLEMIELLLDNEKDPPENSHGICSHLELAIIFRQVEVVELLLRRGTNMQGADAAGDTALHIACWNKPPPFVPRDDDDDENDENDENDDKKQAEASSFLIQESPDLRIVKLLLDSGADTTVTNTSGKTAMHHAAERGFIEVVKLLTANGASHMVSDSLGQLPIHLASQHGHVEIVDYLLGRGADVTSADNGGNTALLLAVQNGHVGIFRLLMRKVSDLLTHNRDNYATLHAAAEQGNLELLRFIVAKCAKADIADASGTTPLHIAARNGHAHSVKYLLGCGIENSMPNNNGATPLHLASQNGHAEVADLLLNHGAIVTATDCNNKTPLDVALQKDQIAVVKVLLQKRQRLI